MKEGDWIFYNAKLNKITKIKNETIVEVTDGSFRTGGDLTDCCFEVNENTTVISRTFAFWMDEVHSISRILNFPDIYRHLSYLWARACKNPADSQHWIMTGQEFIKLVKQEVERIQDIRIQEVKLIR